MTIPKRRATGANPKAGRSARTLHAISVETGDPACPFPRSRLVPQEDEDFEETMIAGDRCPLCESTVARG